MAEYISKQDVIDYLNGYLHSLGEDADTLFNRGQRRALINSIQDILAVKVADVQPVVRCKDCKHRKEQHYEEDGEKPYIKYECKFTRYSMSDGGFCSFGARMDGEQNEDN